MVDEAQKQKTKFKSKKQFKGSSDDKSYGPDKSESKRKRRRIYLDLDESMAKGRKFLDKETDKKGKLSQRAKNLQEAITSARKSGEISKLGVKDIADELKNLAKGGSVTGRSIGPAGASIVSDDGKRIKQLKKIGKSIGMPGAAAGIVSGIQKTVKQLAGRLAKRGYGKARK